MKSYKKYRHMNDRGWTDDNGYFTLLRRIKEITFAVRFPVKKICGNLGYACHQYAEIDLSTRKSKGEETSSVDDEICFNCGII